MDKSNKELKLKMEKRYYQIIVQNDKLILEIINESYVFIVFVFFLNVFQIDCQGLEHK